MGSLRRVNDLHIHIQPWEMLRPEVALAMRAGRRDLDRIEACVRDPGALVRLLDEEGIDRAALINYVSPDLMGFTDTVNAWVADYCRPHRDRLIAVGSVHPRFSQDPGGDAERLFDDGIRMLKLHPPHQLVHANDYRDGGPWPGLAAIYGAAEARGVPIMVHTGTSIFPGARNKYGHPLEVDDVAVDFPRLPLVLAHAGRPLWMEEAFFLARRHPNVHLDLSGIPPARLLEYLPRLETVASKALWGTDWPAPGVPGMGANVAVFRGLPLAAAVQEAILWGNAERLLPRG
jgi:predicted TIM-barrel fold metal-dependent hydrolase